MFKCMVITDPVMVTTDPVMVTTDQSFVLVLYLLWLPQTQSVLGMSPNVRVHGYHAQIQSWLTQANPFFFSITFYAPMAMDTHIALANTKCTLAE